MSSLPGWSPPTPEVSASSLCALLLCPAISEVEFWQCARQKCDVTDEVGLRSYDQWGLLRWIGTALEGVCQQTLCHGTTSETYGKCLISKCLLPFTSADADDTSSILQARVTSAVIADKDLYRKRRVNDDVSQCIQSYCGGKGFESRIYCIVKNCHHQSG